MDVAIYPDRYLLLSSQIRVRNKNCYGHLEHLDTSRHSDMSAVFDNAQNGEYYIWNLEKFPHGAYACKALIAL